MKSRPSLPKQKKPSIFFVRRIVGESMVPALQPGQIVVGVSFLRPKIGDVVVAKVNDKEVIKRVVGMDGDNFELQGDNVAASSDSRNYGPVKGEKIYGRIILHS